MDYFINRIWNSHLIDQIGEYDVLYIDKLVLHDLTSIRAFQNIIHKAKPVFQPQNVYVIPDHIPPCSNDSFSINLKNKIRILSKELKLNYIDYKHPNYGISHLVLENLGILRPGSIIAGGDSHITSAGAFGLLSFAVGTKDIERILLTQALPILRPDQININLYGKRVEFVTEYDIMLFLINQLANMPIYGKIVRFDGSFTKVLSDDQKTTLCNLSAELDVFTSIIEPKGLKYQTIRNDNHETMKKAKVGFKQKYTFNVSHLKPRITFSTSPKFSIYLDEPIPVYQPSFPVNEIEYNKSLEYMGLKPGIKMLGQKIQKVFIGSCSGGKYSDVVAAEKVIKGKKIASHIQAFLSVGSNSIYCRAEKNGIINSFEQAGFKILHPGCSMCTSLSGENIKRNEYIVSTINRNYEGRQGVGVRTILASPISAAFFAIEGYIFKYY